MGRQTNRAPLALSEEDEGHLGKLSRSATAPVREATRAKVLPKCAGGMSIARIQREVGVSRPTICKCIDKALAADARAGLKDRHHRPRAPEILPDARAWAISVACQTPKALGFAAELWTVSALTKCLQGAAEAAGCPRLARISRSSVWKLLQEEELKPHRVRHCLERRDPDQDARCADGLPRRVPRVARGRADGVGASDVHGVGGREAGGAGARQRRPGPAPGAGRAAGVVPGSRVRAPRNGVRPRRPGPARRACPGQRRVPPPQPRVRRPARTAARALPAGRRHSRRPRQPLGARLPRDHGLSGDAAGALRMRPHPQARLLAQPDRVRLLEDGGAPSCATSASTRWTNSRPASSRASTR